MDILIICKAEKEGEWGKLISKTYYPNNLLPFPLPRLGETIEVTQFKLDMQTEVRLFQEVIDIVHNTLYGGENQIAIYIAPDTDRTFVSIEYDHYFLGL